MPEREIAVDGEVIFAEFDSRIGAQLALERLTTAERDGE